MVGCGRLVAIQLCCTIATEAWDIVTVTCGFALVLTMVLIAIVHVVH